MAIFQFHKGTIKTSHCPPWWCVAANFNSIKVRLKPPHLPRNKIYLLFQFHKSTIKTKSTSDFKYQVSLFQFHKGTIKTFAGPSTKSVKSNFNSIKVRLKHDLNTQVYLLHRNFNSIKVRLKRLFGSIIHADEQFQFHKGTIKT